MLARRVVTQSNSRTSAKPLLQSLHWLPIRERIRHKVATQVRVTSTAANVLSPKMLHVHVTTHVRFPVVAHGSQAGGGTPSSAGVQHRPSTNESGRHCVAIFATDGRGEFSIRSDVQLMSFSGAI